jgi:hypothetical protein
VAIQTYQLRVKDLNGATVAIFAGTGRGGGTGDLQSFTYRRRLNSVGHFALYIDGNDDRIPLLKVLNSQVEVWRRDQLGGLAWLVGLDSWRKDARTLVTGWYKDFEGFIRAWNRGFDADGRRQFVFQGRQYNDLLAGDTINYPKGNAGSNKTGLPGAVAAAYVNENVGAGAGLDALGNSRVRLGLTETVESDTATNWSGDKSNVNLLDVLQQLADFGPGDFLVNGTGAATFEFRWRGTRWGLDRTPGNSAGNIPCILSVYNNNVTDVTFGYNALDEVNVVYVAGQGQQDMRNYRTRASATATAFNWSRRAVARDARDANLDATLDARGDAELEDNRARYIASFHVIQTPATRYGRDWDLGDLVRFTDEDGNDTDLKIIGVTVGVNSDGIETITPEMETEP